MTPTIYSFTRALLTPSESFATLGALRPAIDDAGMPRISRTARFAEAQVEWQGAQWLVCMPLAPGAVSEIERTAAHLKSLRSEWLTDYLLLRNEMRHADSTGTEHRSDLVLQRITGIAFTDAASTQSTETLLKALDALESELQRLDLSHRNLKAENLRWSNGRILPVRYHYARTGFGGDAEAFDALRAELLRSAGNHQTAHDVQAPYGISGDRFPGHHWVSNVFEQMVCVEDEAGWGYVDTSNRPVIPSQFRWADDFHEGRAAVETSNGMGLIDKTGRYVIPAHYEIVEYDPSTGRSQVRQNGRWAEFDYEGRQLCEFCHTRETLPLENAIPV